MRTRIGKVTHFFNRLSVAVVRLEAPLKIGDVIHFYGHTTDFVQHVGSMEIEHRKVDAVGAGAEIGLLVIDRVRVGDDVFKLTGEDAVEIGPASMH